MIHMTSTETRQAVSALGSRVVNDRLARANVVGGDKKGRTLVEMVGTETEAEQAFFTLAALMRLTRMV